MDGPIRLAGHSAGGHLVARQLCADSRLPEAVLARVERVVPISGLHDLRPLLRLDAERDAAARPAGGAAESPALADVRGGRAGARLGRGRRAAGVRAAERRCSPTSGPGSGSTCALTIEPGRHHFNVIDGLTDPGSELVEAIVGAAGVKTAGPGGGDRRRRRRLLGALPSGEGGLDRRDADRALGADERVELACGGRVPHAERRPERREAPGLHGRALPRARGDLRAVVRPAPDRRGDAGGRSGADGLPAARARQGAVPRDGHRDHHAVRRRRRCSR